MNLTEKQAFNRELLTLAIPLALLNCFVFDWSVMAVFIIMRLDEIVKVPFIKGRYSKFI